MKRLFILGGLIGAFFFSTGAFGADGQKCQDSDDADIPLASKGIWIPDGCVQLCDGKDSNDSACTEWDFNTGAGMPDLIIFEYEENPDDATCSATPDFTLTTGPVSNGGLAAAGVPAYTFDTSAVVLNTTTHRVVVVTKDAPLDRFLFTAIADDAACSDVDIRMFFYNKKPGRS